MLFGITFIAAFLIHLIARVRPDWLQLPALFEIPALRIFIKYKLY
jgi:hypothetical protein